MSGSRQKAKKNKVRIKFPDQKEAETRKDFRLLISVISQFFYFFSYF